MRAVVGYIYFDFFSVVGSLYDYVLNYLEDCYSGIHFLLGLN